MQLKFVDGLCKQSMLKLTRASNQADVNLFVTALHSPAEGIQTVVGDSNEM